ncbi:hypothetical protein PPS11_01834 [Pseudomonas putida S11]|nr:hypothetical protein PPS11_01834 [Pseudomonas putida S11]
MLLDNSLSSTAGLIDAATPMCVVRSFPGLPQTIRCPAGAGNLAFGAEVGHMAFAIVEIGTGLASDLI